MDVRGVARQEDAAPAVVATLRPLMLKPASQIGSKAFIPPGPRRSIIACVCSSVGEGGSFAGRCRQVGDHAIAAGRDRENDKHAVAMPVD